MRPKHTQNSLICPSGTKWRSVHWKWVKRKRSKWMSLWRDCSFLRTSPVSSDRPRDASQTSNWFARARNEECEVCSWARLPPPARTAAPALLRPPPVQHKSARSPHSHALTDCDISFWSCRHFVYCTLHRRIGTQKEKPEPQRPVKAAFGIPASTAL